MYSKTYKGSAIKKPPPTPIPCYSDQYPPEIGTRVVVKCKRVDDNGIWGTLPDWAGAPFNCTVYLPLGYIAQQRGRGERRAQAEFLTRAKRLVSKDMPFHFVGEVDDVDESSSNAVDSITAAGKQITQTFLLTVYRRGLSKQDEKDTMEASKATQHCGSLIVDKAAVMVAAGIEREKARRWCLYGPYHESLNLKMSADGSNEEATPSLAACRLLIKQLGTLPKGSEDEALAKLRISKDKQSRKVDSFVKTLLPLCRKEFLRISKPIPFSLSGKLSNVNSAVQNVSTIKSLFVTVQNETELPAGFTKLKMTAEGNGRYCFSTNGSKDSSDAASRVLATALSRARDLYNSAPSADMNGVQERNRIVPSAKVNHSPRSISQPTLNIGLIGDVANGKSTLVRAITGKRTQSHSSEQQKHGMTIRLGFANSSVLRCKDISCGLFSFRKDEVADELDKPPNCAYCGGSAEVITRISFIDTPGHSDLLPTMLSGASAVDAVIVAAASNVPCPSPQARQHLDALRVSGQNFNGRIAIAQTKAELLAQACRGAADDLTGDKLTAHASSGRENLRKTVASNAPFFPTCAPLEAGLEPLAAWLASLCSKGANKQHSEGSTIFRTLRSFDVNYAGTSTQKLVGGVLGGSIQGPGGISRGETLEIRPGLIFEAADKKPPSVFKTHPVRFQVEEIMTGKNALESASAGGLVALRTTLDPSFCTDDRLIGSVVGAPGTLPPVWGPGLFLDKLRSLDSSSSKKEKALKKDSKVRVHAGSASVTGRIVRVSYSKQKMELFLDSPICAPKYSNIAIEAKSPSNKFTGYSLVAYGSVVDGSVSFQGVEKETVLDQSKDARMTALEPDQDHRCDEGWALSRFLEELADM